MKNFLGILVAKLASKKIVQIFGTFGLITGIISDVLQPLAPFTSYLFFASAIFSVLLLFTYLFFKRLRIKVLTSLTIAIIILFFSGSFYILQNITTIIIECDRINHNKTFEILLNNNFKIVEKYFLSRQGTSQ